MALTDVFINCPFDPDYRPLIEAFTFAVHDCGFRARCSQEVSDAGEVRIEKIKRLIRECKFGIHDISRTEVDTGTELPRFNMPLELGLFMGAKAFGDASQQVKVTLVFEKSKYSYHKYCSDISGQDIDSHERDTRRAIASIRNWLAGYVDGRRLPGPADMANRYELFQKKLPAICRKLGWKRNELLFADYVSLVVEYLEAEQGLLRKTVRED